MESVIKGAPSFAYIEMDLAPGESVIAESDAMASMDADLEMTTRLHGGLFGAPISKFLGGESYLIKTF